MNRRRLILVKTLVLLSHGVAMFCLAALLMTLPAGSPMSASFEFTVPLRHRALSAAELATGTDRFIDYEWSAAGAGIAKRTATLYADSPGRVETPNGNALVELVVHVPYWLVLLAAFPLPVWFWSTVGQRSAARRRESKGRCPACGYDLRATPSRCPECGAARLQPSRL